MLGIYPISHSEITNSPNDFTTKTSSFAIGSPQSPRQVEIKFALELARCFRCNSKGLSFFDRGSRNDKGGPMEDTGVDCDVDCKLWVVSEIAVVDIAGAVAGDDAWRSTTSEGWTLDLALGIEPGFLPTSNGLGKVSSRLGTKLRNRFT